MKRVLRPERLRHVPHQFSWVDHRLVRDGHMGRCSAEALALYLFLITVGDAEGLSYYGEKALERYLSCSAEALGRAREELLRAGLIAYERPLYQVLSLDRVAVAEKQESCRRGGEMSSIGSILQLALGGK
jgi:hypothetical protein